MKEKKSTERPDFEVLCTVFYYCFAIIVCPVITFFGAKAVLFETFADLSNVVTNVYAAVAAVIVLHIALGAFIYKAYSESTPTLKPVKVD